MPQLEVIHPRYNKCTLSSHIYTENDKFLTNRDSEAVCLSIIKFDLKKGEDIFLSYTHGREHGPIIERTGNISPFMSHLYAKYPGQRTNHPEGFRLRTWLILNSLRGDQNSLQTSQTSLLQTDWARVQSKLAKTNQHLSQALSDGQKLEIDRLKEIKRTLDCYKQENPTIPAHDTQFCLTYQDHEIIGMQGCGDLTMNLWNVAYLNSPLTPGDKPLLIYAHEEPISQRIYSCLIKQKPDLKSYQVIRDKLAIEDVRFDANASGIKGMIYVNRNGNWQACGDEVEFALSNEQVLRDGKLVKLNHITEEFSDLRHLLYLPNLNPPVPLQLSGVFEDTGRPRLYFGNNTDEDIWFGEAQLLHHRNLQRAAMEGPIFLSRLYQGLGASKDQIRGAMALAEYEEVKELRQELKVGQYRFVPEDDRQIEVYFKRNLYSWSMIGLNRQKNKILSLACEGCPLPGDRFGYVLEEAVEELRRAGAENALLIDEGADVFQVALLGKNGTTVQVGNKNADLDVVIPLLRTRLRATLIFAQKKQTQQNC